MAAKSAEIPSSKIQPISMQKQGEMLAKIEILGFQQNLKAESAFADANAPAKSAEIPSSKIQPILMEK